MIVSVLFNSDDPKFDGSYGDPIRDIVFGTGVIQNSKRHMKVSVGDVLIYSNARSWNDYDRLSDLTYFSGTWSVLLKEKLQATFRRATVYALTFENMTKEIAICLHGELLGESSYLGLMEVDYTKNVHLALFKNSMIPMFRVCGNNCRVFYNMGEEDGKCEWQVSAMQDLGFDDVDHEDRGAHGTIFDDFDTIAHFRRIARFRNVIGPYLSGGEDDACELVMMLEDLNPRLFNGLGAAVDALERAENEEDIAQAAISGRRYMERFADVIFPAREEMYRGRKVGSSQYRNRIWAYVADCLSDNNVRLGEIGGKIDHIIEEFNAGLHGDIEKTRFMKAFALAAIVTAEILSLDPVAVRQPYYAHARRMNDFFKEAFGFKIG